jgi:hypothetical protein
MCGKSGFLDTLRRRFYHRHTRKIACKVFRMLTLEASTMLFTRSDSRRTIWGGILILALLVLPLSGITARADEPVGGAPPAPSPAPAPAPEATPAPAAATPAPPPTTPPPEATAAPAPAPAKDLKTSVRDFWHYGKVARYDLANAEGQKILASGAQPVQILDAPLGRARRDEGCDRQTAGDA